jgi:hypothetical protein
MSQYGCLYYCYGIEGAAIIMGSKQVTTTHGCGCRLGYQLYLRGIPGELTVVRDLGAKQFIGIDGETP